MVVYFIGNKDGLKMAQEVCESQSDNCKNQIKRDLSI